jgi:hypothetical protein
MNFTHPNHAIMDRCSGVERAAFFTSHPYHHALGASVRWASFYVPPLAALHFRLSWRFRDQIRVHIEYVFNMR